MERKEIIVPARDSREKDTSFWVVKRWCVVHARTGTLAQQNVRPCDTREEAQRDCDCIVKNNPPDIVARFFPDGVRPAQWWCYESHGGSYRSAEEEQTHIDIRTRKDGKVEWSIYFEREKPVWTEEPTLEEAKRVVLDIFPDAVFKVLS